MNHNLSCSRCPRGVMVAAILLPAATLLAQGSQPSTAQASTAATYAVSNARWHDDPPFGSAGFLRGLRGFEHFYEPVGQPLYFESPFNDTGLRFLFLHHEFDNASQLQGGDLDVFAVQARVALTERLAFIATKDGYSMLDAGLLPKDEGWNDIAIGLKYAVIVDRDQDMVVTPGFRWEWSHGDKEVLQGNGQEFSPFISAAKGFDQLHTIANVTYRKPESDNNGNQVLQWDLHADYEVANGLAPLVELHGLHYLTDGNRLPLSVGGLDYANLGSSDVAGTSVVWLGVGARMKFNPHTAFGATYEFALTDPEDDIMDTRITLDFILKW